MSFDFITFGSVLLRKSTITEVYMSPCEVSDGKEYKGQWKVIVTTDSNQWTNFSDEKTSKQLYDVTMHLMFSDRQISSYADYMELMNDILYDIGKTKEITVGKED